MVVIRPGGAFVSLAHATSTHPKANVSQFTLICDHERHDDLDALKAVIEAGKIKAHIHQSFALPDLVKAFELSAGHGVVGKVAVLVSPEAASLSPRSIQGEVIV